MSAEGLVKIAGAGKTSIRRVPVNKSVTGSLTMEKAEAGTHRRWEDKWRAARERSPSKQAGRLL